MRKSQLCTLTAFAGVALAAPAPAATVTAGSGGVVYQAAPGETNRPDIRPWGQQIHFARDTTTLTPGTGCAAHPNPDFGGFICPAAPGTQLIVRLGDGDDLLGHGGGPGHVVMPAGVELRVEAGSGDDELHGTRRNDTLLGGSGKDKVWAAGGRDSVDGGDGNDDLHAQGTVKGGDGNDLIEVEQRGVFGFVASNIASKVFGGAGNDTISATNKRRDVIDCGSGRRDVAHSWERRIKDTIRRNCERGQR